jgi:hypothetical protein
MAYTRTRRQGRRKTAPYTKSTRGTTSSRSYMPSIPKGIIDGLTKAVSNQLSLGASAGKRIARETSSAVARQSFEKRRPASASASTSGNIVRVQRGSQGLRQLNYTVKLGPGLKKLKGVVGSELARLKKNDCVQVLNTGVIANDRLSPSMTPSVVLNKGADGSERIPMAIFTLNPKTSSPFNIVKQPDPDSYGSWLSSVQFDTNTYDPASKESTWLTGEYSLLRYVKARILLYGARQRQARYRVVVFRPRFDAYSHDIYNAAGNSVAVGDKFQSVFMGHYSEWFKKHTTNPVSTQHRDPRLEVQFKKAFDVRFDKEIVIDETGVDEDSLKQVLLNIYMPVGLSQDYTYGHDQDLDPNHENPEAIAPATVGYFVGASPRHNQRWYCMIVANETQDDTEITNGAFKNMGFDVSVTTSQECYKADSNNTNSFAVG